MVLTRGKQKGVRVTAANASPLMGQRENYGAAVLIFSGPDDGTSTTLYIHFVLELFHELPRRYLDR
jgi:hypothetical protein